MQDDIETAIMYTPKIKNIELFVTENCNLSCRYCFHPKVAKNMSSEILEKTLSFLEPHFAENCDFSFFGGEPLLCEEFILKSAERIRQRFPSTKFFISTNAMMYSEKIVDLVNGSDSNTLQLSYDGLDQALLRGEQDRVTENVKRYIDSVEKNTLTFRMTYTPETVGHLCENIIYMHQLGCRNVMHGAEFCSRWTCQHIDTYRDQLNKIYDFVSDKPDFKVVFADCKSVVSLRKEPGCKMGKEMLAISADGDIYPCHRAVAHKEFKLGNVHEERLNRGMFLTLKIDECERCTVKSSCAACYVANYEYEKSLKKPIKCACDINIIQHTKASAVYATKYGLQDRIKSTMVPVLEDVLETSRKIKELIGAR